MDDDIRILEEVLGVPVGRLRAGKNPRTHFGREGLEELADSVRADGVIEPIVARDAGGGMFEIVYGERRWRAAKLAGLAEVPVIVRDLDGAEGMVQALVENLQREDLNPVDEAQGFADLLGAVGSAAEVARRVGRPETTVRRRLGLLRLPAGILDLVERGGLAPSAAESVAGLGLEDAELARCAGAFGAGGAAEGLRAAEALAWLARAEREGDTRLPDGLEVLDDAGRLMPARAGEYVDLSERPLPEELRPGVNPAAAPTWGRILEGERAERALGKNWRRVRLGKLALAREVDGRSESPVLRAAPCSRARAEAQAKERERDAAEREGRRRFAEAFAAMCSADAPEVGLAEARGERLRIRALEIGAPNRQWLLDRYGADVGDAAAMASLSDLEPGAAEALDVCMNYLRWPAIDGAARDALEEFTGRFTGGGSQGAGVAGGGGAGGE